MAVFVRKQARNMHFFVFSNQLQSGWKNELEAFRNLIGVILAHNLLKHVLYDMSNSPVQTNIKFIFIAFNLRSIIKVEFKPFKMFIAHFSNI